MDDLYLYLIGGAIVVIAIIVLNHKKQKNKMDSFLQNSGDTPQMFLLKSVEKKIKTLSTILYDGGVRPAAGLPKAGGRKQILIDELEQLEKDYTSKKITLKVYDQKLFELINKAKKVLPATVS